MKPPLSPEQFAALRGLNACTLANAIETFHERLFNEGYVNNSVGCLFPEFPPMLGYAATVKIHGSAPPMVGRQYIERTDWWDYILSLPEPRVVVIQDIASRVGVGSLVGAVHMNILRALRCVGVVTNGAVRDIPAAQQAGFHLFAGNVSVSHAYVHIVEFGQTLDIGGLKIQSGDLLHGDLHGVQSVPHDIAGRIPAVAAQITAQERQLIELCQRPDFSLEKLRAALASARFPTTNKSFGR